MESRNLKKVWKTGLMTMLCICFLAVFPQKASAMQSVSIKEDITIECIDGTKYRPQDFAEEFVVLAFGRTTCGNTVGMLTRAEDMLKCGASMKLVLMDIETEDAGMQSFAQTHPDIVVAHGASGYNRLMWNLLSKAGTGSGSITLPAIFVMDKSRTIVYASTGYIWDDFRETMEAVCPVPHNYVEIRKEATCSQTGFRYEQCSICGAEKPDSREILPAQGHQFGPEATCTEAQLCTRCNEVLKPALGHEWTGWNTVEGATVFAPEKQESHCKRAGCGERRTRNVGTSLPAMLVLPESELSLKVNDTYECELGMQTGDYLNSVISSRDGIVEISNVKESGSFLLRGQKAGQVFLTVELASGARDTITVTVKNAEIPAEDKGGTDAGSKAPSGNDTGKTDAGSKTPSGNDAGKTNAGNKTPQKDSTGKTDTVSKKPTKKKTVKTTAIKKVPKKIVLKRGKSKTLKPVRVPAKSKQKITFISSNKKVATVNKKGKITAKRKGTAIITVKCGSKKVKCKVIVKK